MVKITAQIDGMACGMCEAHVQDAVRKAFPVKKVKASSRKRELVIVAPEAIGEAELRSAINPTGYTVTGVSVEPYEKKGFFAK
jgi:copper chaperone CopZ